MLAHFGFVLLWFGSGEWKQSNVWFCFPPASRIKISGDLIVKMFA